MSDKIKNLQARAQALDQDKNFLQSHLIESKRQNKLLKLAIGRLEMEVNQRDKTIEQLNKPIPITMANMDQQIDAGALVDGTTFLTEPKTQ